jgi:hypothetical protein
VPGENSAAASCVAVRCLVRSRNDFDKDALTEDGVARVIAELRTRFDWVICDSPAGEADYKMFRIIMTTELLDDYETWLRVRERGKLGALTERGATVAEVEVSLMEFANYCKGMRRPNFSIGALDQYARKKATAQAEAWGFLISNWWIGFMFMPSRSKLAILLIIVRSRRCFATPDREANRQHGVPAPRNDSRPVVKGGRLRNVI